MNIAKIAVAETLGTAFLLAVVVGSGIMAERLAGGSAALALLANALATGAGLFALILTFASVSGAHFNPLVTLMQAWFGETPWRQVPFFLGAQFFGAFVGVAAAHFMFGEPLWSWSTQGRSGLALCGSEFVASLGLLLVVLGCGRGRPAATPAAVACYITAAYWFTASTSFANPAVTLARMVSNTFAGIFWADVSAFILAQLAALLCAGILGGWLFQNLDSSKV